MLFRFLVNSIRNDCPSRSREKDDRILQDGFEALASIYRANSPPRATKDRLLGNEGEKRRLQFDWTRCRRLFLMLIARYLEDDVLTGRSQARQMSTGGGLRATVHSKLMGIIHDVLSANEAMEVEKDADAFRQIVTNLVLRYASMFTGPTVSSKTTSKQVNSCLMDIIPLLPLLTQAQVDCSALLSALCYTITSSRMLEDKHFLPLVRQVCSVVVSAACRRGCFANVYLPTSCLVVSVLQASEIDLCELVACNHHESSSDDKDKSCKFIYLYFPIAAELAHDSIYTTPSSIANTRTPASLVLARLRDERRRRAILRLIELVCYEMRVLHKAQDGNDDQTLLCCALQALKACVVTASILHRYCIDERSNDHHQRSWTRTISNMLLPILRLWTPTTPPPQRRESESSLMDFGAHLDLRDCTMWSLLDFLSSTSNPIQIDLQHVIKDKFVVLPLHLRPQQQQQQPQQDFSEASRATNTTLGGAELDSADPSTRKNRRISTIERFSHIYTRAGLASAATHGTDPTSYRPQEGYHHAQTLHSRREEEEGIGCKTSHDVHHAEGTDSDDGTTCPHEHPKEGIHLFNAMIRAATLARIDKLQRAYSTMTNLGAKSVSREPHAGSDSRSGGSAQGTTAGAQVPGGAKGLDFNHGCGFSDASRWSDAEALRLLQEETDCLIRHLSL